MQKQKHDQDGECTALEDRLLDVVQRLLDIDRILGDGPNLHIGRQLLAQLGHGFGDLVSDCHQIGVLRLEDIDGKGRLAVNAPDALLLTLAITDCGHLLQQHRSTGATGHDDLAKRLHTLQLAFHPHQLLGLIGAQRPGRQILVDFADRAHHLVNTNPVGKQLLWLQANLHLALHRASDVDQPHARHALQSLDDLLVGEGR